MSEVYEVTPLTNGTYSVKIFNGTVWLELGIRATLKEALEALNKAKEEYGQ